MVSTEPIRGDNPLLKAKNCILTPHISWAPKESRQRIMDCTVDNVRAYLAGSPHQRGERLTAASVRQSREYGEED